jgi:hypothetical protein
MNSLTSNDIARIHEEAEIEESKQQLSVIISADEQRLKDSGQSNEVYTNEKPQKKFSVKINPYFDKKIKKQLQKIKKKSNEELNFKSHDCLLNRRFGQR